ncbi:11947_t:CDS:2 [Diversispora eburnea]|uniref:11947_t:CDS:1 n=1 Tax=Diversispora eburnea TaxID=1213867 RepID=A0A9N8ZV25_9GLOM|nr:11947_t:CDS:2 [Diversispora eburnea]
MVKNMNGQIGVNSNGQKGKWIAKGEPYEEHEEVLMQRRENEITHSGHDDDITLSEEEENIAMEELFIEVPERAIKTTLW